MANKITVEDGPRDEVLDLLSFSNGEVVIVVSHESSYPGPKYIGIPVVRISDTVAYLRPSGGWARLCPNGVQIKARRLRPGERVVVEGCVEDEG